MLEMDNNKDDEKRLGAVFWIKSDKITCAALQAKLCWELIRLL